MPLDRQERRESRRDAAARRDQRQPQTVIVLDEVHAEHVQALHRHVLESPDSNLARALAGMSEALRYGHRVTVTIGDES